jgi:hypothetical protein
MMLPSVRLANPTAPCLLIVRKPGAAATGLALDLMKPSPGPFAELFEFQCQQWWYQRQKYDQG